MPFTCICLLNDFTEVYSYLWMAVYILDLYIRTKLNFRQFYDIKFPMWTFWGNWLWHHNCTAIWRTIRLWCHTEKSTNRCDVGPFKNTDGKCILWKFFFIKLLYFWGFSLFRHFKGISFQLVKLRRLGKDHCWWCSTRITHMVHTVH